MDGYPSPQQQTPKPLSPKDKTNWNKFIDFVEMQKMKGNPQLDRRDKQIGMGLLQKFNYANPGHALPMDIVPQVQQELNDYRDKVVQQYKQGKLQVTPDVKSENDIMAGISKIDGWPGTKTLSSKFPVAVATDDVMGEKTTKNYGTDIERFEKERGLKK